MSRLIKENTGITIVKMALPMLAGTFAINMYNLTNVWFVSRLGTDSLAAISFAFPVIMLLTFIVRGIGTGVMSLTARLIGEKDTANTSKLIIHSLIFAVLTAFLMTLAGILTAKMLFAKLGASGNTLSLALEYMNIWYLGSVIMVVHMILGDIIMSTGNTRAISALMVGGTVVNIFFDLGLIFGKFGMPALGIKGAAIATIISQSFTLTGALFILFVRLKIIVPIVLRLNEIRESWIKIIKFAVPSSLGMIMTPVSAAVITKLVAGYGDEAVAAAGVAGRIEMFAFMIPMTVGMSLIPFVAQNYGAGRTDRIKEARVITMSFAAIYGLFIAALFFIFSRPMAVLFSSDPNVINVLVLYIKITCAGYGMLEIHRYAGFCLLGMQAPVQASVLDIVRIVILLIPLSIIGEKLFHLNGIFTGRLLTDLAAGAVGIIWSGMVIKRKESK